MTTLPKSEPARGLKAIAEKGACCGYAECTQICPEVFKLDENGIVSIPVPIIPAELHARAREAVAACPQSALRVEEF